jgi:predicted metal-dependent hydrolase
MTYVDITGGSPTQQKYVESMIKYCVKMLMPRMKTLEISVKFTTPKGAMGYCLKEGAREYEIELDRRLRLRPLLITVAHEMVHVKQYARREMHDFVVDEKFHKWKDSLVPENTNYWDLPWEIEAHGRELGLFVRWCEANKLGKLPWTQVQ